MADLVLENDNVLTVGEKAWHGKDDNRQFANLDDVASFLDYEVELQPVYLQNGYRVKGRSATFTRTPEGQILTFDTVSDDYTIYQNRDAIEILRPYEDMGLTVETAGTLKNKALAFITMKLSGSINLGHGDTVNKYVLFSNSHDGTAAVRLGLTCVRVVCFNTLSAAHGNKSSKLIGVFHGKEVKQNVEQVASMLDVINQRFVATEEAFKRLTTKQINQKDLRKVVKIAFKVQDLEDMLAAGESPEEKEKRVFKQIEEAFETAPGQDLVTANGTAWGLYNAITYHLTHRKGRTEDNRKYNNWFGENANINNRALAACLALD